MVFRAVCTPTPSLSENLEDLESGLEVSNKHSTTENFKSEAWAHPQSTNFSMLRVISRQVSSWKNQFIETCWYGKNLKSNFVQLPFPETAPDW